jgi:hypothetical protein
VASHRGLVPNVSSQKGNIDVPPQRDTKRWIVMTKSINCVVRVMGQILSPRDAQCLCESEYVVMCQISKTGPLVIEDARRLFKVAIPGTCVKHPPCESMRPFTTCLNCSTRSI